MQRNLGLVLPPLGLFCNMIVNALVMNYSGDSHFESIIRVNLFTR
jgi:hypothetical protein